MKSEIVTLVELVCSQGVDDFDGEPVEERLDCGYFLSEQKLYDACERLAVDLNDGWVIEKTTYEIKMSKKQKWLYVLFYEYSIGEDVFYYSFKPCTSVTKCAELKLELLKNEKYQHNAEKHYSNNNYGWRIEKHKIIK